LPPLPPRAHNAPVKAKAIPAHRPVRSADRRATDAPERQRVDPCRPARGVLLGTVLGSTLWAGLLLVLRRLFG